MNKQKLKEKLTALVDGILDETIDIPNNAVIALPESSSIFTKKRLELIDKIKSHHPKSVKELSKMTKRTKQAVTRDLKILERFEIVRLEKNGRNTIPLVERDVIVLTIPRHNHLPCETNTALGEVF